MPVEVEDASTVPAVESGLLAFCDDDDLSGISRWKLATLWHSENHEY